MIGGGTFQKLFDLRVGRLGKIVVKLNDSLEVLRRDGADRFVDDLVKLAAGIGRAYRNRHHNMGSSPFPERTHCRPHGRAGGQL